MTLDSLDSFLTRLYSPDDALFLRGVIESPRDEQPIREYAKFLRDRGDPRSQYLELFAGLLATEKATKVPDENLASAFRGLQQSLDFPMKMVWFHLVEGQWRLPKGLCLRGRLASEIIVRLLLEDPVCFLYAPLLSPTEWRAQQKRCPASTLLLMPQGEYLWPDGKWEMFGQLLEEFGFLAALRNKKYFSIHDQVLSSDDVLIKKLTAPTPDYCAVEWRLLDYINASRKVGICQTYIQLDLYEKTGNLNTPSIFMHHRMPVLSTWSGFSELLDSMEKKLDGFSKTKLQTLPDDGSEIEVWRKIRRKVGRNAAQR